MEENFKEENLYIENHQLKAKRPFFSCSLCLDTFKQPKVLHCIHSFCLECLTRYIPENSISIVCPTCNLVSVIPKDGVESLPDNWMLTSMKAGKSSSIDLLTIKHSSRMLDTIDGIDIPKDLQYELETDNCDNDDLERIKNSIENKELGNSIEMNDGLGNEINNTSISMQLTDNMDSLSLKQSDDNDCPSNIEFFSNKDQMSRQAYNDLHCDTASSSAIVMDESLGGETSQSLFFSQSYRSSSEFSNEKLYCRIHPLKNLDMYCQVCDLPLCMKCSEMGHDQHEIVCIDMAIQNQKAILTHLTEQLKNETKDIENNKIFIERVKGDLECNFIKVRDQLNNRFNNMINILHKKLDSNLQELNSIYSNRNELLDKQIACINKNYENSNVSYDLAEKILDSERSELILLANKCYASEDYGAHEVIKKINSKKQCSFPEKPIESSFICFNPDCFENLEKYSSHLNGIVSDRSLCSNMISFSIEDLRRPVNVNRKFKLAIYLLEDNTSIVNDYISKVNSVVYALVFMPNGQQKLAEFCKEDSDNKLGYICFIPDQVGIHKLEIYNFGVLVRETPVEFNVSKFSLSANSTSSSYSHFSSQKTTKPVSKRQLGQSTFQNKLSSSSSNFINKPIPAKELNTSFSRKALSKTLTNPTSKHKSNTNLIRPPWNNSVAKNTKTSVNTQPLCRSLSSTVPRNDLSHRLSNTSLHKLDKSSKITSRRSSNPVINATYKERVKIDSKLQVQAKIDEEEAELYEDNHEKYGINNRENYNSVKNILNKSLPLVKNSDLKTIRRRSANVCSQAFAPRQNSVPSKNQREKPTLLKSNSKLSNEIYKKYGMKGRGMGEFNSLQDVAYGRGLLYSSDAKNQCIQILDFSTGRFLKQILLGEGLSKPPSPSGLAVDLSGYIYVSDIENHCVLVLDPKGRLVRKIGQNQLKGPKGIALTEKELIVADMKGCSIQIFEKSSGNLLLKFGSQGYKDENLCSPQFCSFMPEENCVLVTDFRTDKIKIFTKEGQLIRCFGSTGTRSGQLKGPTGVAVHPTTGYIYVCDFSNTRIQVFSKEGIFVERVTLSLSAPQGLGFLDEEYFMVADAGNHCIKVARAKQNFQ